MTRRVYFLRPIGMDGPVKIGCSIRPQGRCITITTWTPFPLEIVAEIDGGFDLERRFHAKFRADHSHSEWFRWSPELQVTIDSVCAGSFDVSTLPAPARLKVAGKGKRRWTPEQLERAALGRQAKRLTKETDRLPADYSVEALAAFVSDPVKHGRPREDVFRENAKETAERLRRAAATYIEMAEHHEKKAA